MFSNINSFFDFKIFFEVISTFISFCFPEGQKGGVAYLQIGKFEEAVNNYGRLIFSICHTMTGDFFVAEDLTQDTFLSAYQHLADFHGGSVKAWLTTIAANKCRDYLKSAARRSVAMPDDYLVTVADEATPEQTVLEKCTRERLFHLCKQLKEPYQSLSITYFCKEIPISEIAANTGKNSKTLQTQLYRAKAMLRKLWKEEST